jgi:hypothetical protein
MKKAITENEKELLDCLSDVINQACYVPGENEMDSSALTAYAIGLHLLAEYGVVKIKTEYGRRVIAEFLPLSKLNNSANLITRLEIVADQLREDKLKPMAATVEEAIEELRK